MVEVDNGREPVGADKAGVAADEIGAIVAIANFQIVKFNLNMFGGDDVFGGKIGGEGFGSGNRGNFELGHGCLGRGR